MIDFGAVPLPTDSNTAMLIKTTPLLLALTLALAPACGGGKDARALVSEANTALNSGDYAAALSSFDAALGAIEPADAALRRDAELGRCEALAYVDANKAKSEFLALADRETLNYSAYNTVAVALTSEQKFDEAIAVLTKGKEKLPDEPKFEKLVQKVGDAAKNAGAGDAMKALEGLGYVGN